MKRHAQAFLFAALTFTMAAPSCSWFEKHPVIPAVVTCSGETIPLALVTQVYNDVMSDNWFDLATNVVPLLKDGYADIECIFGYLKTSNPETVPHIQKLTAAHVDEFKGSVSVLSAPERSHVAADAPLAWLGSTPAGALKHSLAPKALQAPVVPGTTARGKLSLASCDPLCGGKNTSLAPPSGCLCHAGKGMASRWVPLRERAGLGLVAAR